MSRREVTGRKPGVSAHHETTEPAVAARLPTASPTPRLTLTIAQFCEAFNISEAFFYKLRKRGQGPREMEVGARRLISIEAAVEWRRQREEASEANASMADKA